MEPTDDRYRRLVQASPDGILVSQHGRIVFVNPAGARLVGASTPEHLHDVPTESLFHPDSQFDVHQLIEQALSPGIRPTTEARTMGIDGTQADVEVTAASLGDPADGAVQLVLHEAGPRRSADAALRESEERLRLAFAGAQEGVWDWNLETGAVVYSARWKHMLGYADDEIEPHVGAWERLLHPDDKPRAEELTESLARGAQTYEGEFRLRHKDGHFVHILSRGFPVRRQPDGPVVRIVGMHLDITDR
ncbi:MAG TPA: PAS domain-containing protein, partial [Vicinamibacterales bacterium]